MRYVEIGFGEKKLLMVSGEYPKFIGLWTRLQGWLKLINQEDWLDFKYFFHSKHNKVSNRSKIILERLLDAIPVEGRIISGSNLYKQCFPNQKEISFDEKLKKLGKELQGIIQIIQNYLSYSELRNDPKMQQKLLLNSLKRKNNYELFLEAILKFEELLNLEPFTLKQAQDYWELHHQHYNHPSTRHADYQASTFKDVIYSFETFSQLVYLGYYIDALVRNVKLKPEDLTLIQNKVEPILSHPENLTELSQLYVLAIKMAKDNQLDEYEKFQALYNKLHQQLSETDHLNFIKSIFSVLYRVFNVEGDENIARLSFNWMMKSWHFHLYEHEGCINDGDYLNFMILAFFFKKYELFTEFQQAYDHLLDPGIVKDVKAFCAARLHFEKSEYFEALNLLNTYFRLGSTTIDPTYDIRVKALRVMIYFEMLFKQVPLEIFEHLPQKSKTEEQGLDDLLVNSMNALKQYCFRLKQYQLDEQLLIGNRRFVQIVGLFLEYLLAESHGDAIVKRKQLAEKIQATMKESRPLAYRIWLKKIFAELTVSLKGD